MRRFPRGGEGWRYGPPKLNRQSSGVVCLLLMSLMPPLIYRFFAIKKGAHRPSGCTKRIYMRLSYRYRRRSGRRYHPRIVRSPTTVISCERYHDHNFSPCQDFSNSVNVFAARKSAVIKPSRNSTSIAINSSRAVLKWPYYMSCSLPQPLFGRYLNALPVPYQPIRTLELWP